MKENRAGILKSSSKNLSCLTSKILYVTKSNVPHENESPVVFAQWRQQSLVLSSGHKKKNPWIPTFAAPVLYFHQTNDHSEPFYTMKMVQLRHAILPPPHPLPLSLSPLSLSASAQHHNAHLQMPFYETLQTIVEPCACVSVCVHVHMCVR